MLFTRGCLGLVVLTIAAAAVYSQANSATPKKDLVFVRVPAFDEKSGEFVKGLNKSKFQITEGKTHHSVEYFSGTEEAATIGFLVDLSGSMEAQDNNQINEIEYAVEGIRRFLKSGGSGYTYFVHGFSDKPVDVVDFTTDLSNVRKGLEELSILKPKGNTGVFDAVSTALNKLSQVKGKKVLVIASDGIDNRSKISFKKLEQQIRESGVSIHLVNCVRPEEVFQVVHFPDNRRLEYLVKELGGVAFLPKNRESVGNSFEYLANNIRSQYLIGFTPSGDKTQKWHKVTISIETGLGKKDRFVAQTGYYF